MQLSKTNRSILVNELKTICEYMNKANSYQEKMYFFSAVYGIALRIMNIEYDSELSFVHHVTHNAHNTINASLSLIAQGNTMPTIPDKFFDKLQNLINDLAICIEGDTNTYSVLEKISNLAYCTSGNGYYLLLKGKLKI